MGLVETIASEVIKRLLTRSKVGTDSGWKLERLQSHLCDVVNWSRRVEFLGLAEARSTDSDTVALFASLPRRFRGNQSSLIFTSEYDLIVAEGSVVLLGDPGAGKTTTLKRIARALLDAPATLGDTAEYPLLVRLREVSSELLVEESVAQALGVTTTRKILPPNDGFQVVSGKRTAIDVLAEIMNDSNALLLVDGLDEVRPELRKRTEEALVQLARKCVQARIRLTCRSGDYSNSLEGFDAIELCPLEAAQQEEIVNRWCTAPTQFQLALNQLPFRDLASRPLFLCELIVLFEKTGFLPQQPAAVYRRIVLLALEEWDRSKRVERRSRYAGFDPARKFEFLASLAFHLTYRTERKFFTSETFALAYALIRSQFELPAGEEKQLFEELETHTGIIVEAGFDRYEFSHLSLQEFLAADYQLRDRLTSEIWRQMIVNPAPLAISVAMSSNASERLAAIFLSSWNETGSSKINFESFFSRVAQERAVFREDILLGFAGLAILFGKLDTSPFVQAFLSSSMVQRSIGLALKAYVARKVDEDSFRLRIRYVNQAISDLQLPSHGEINHMQLQPILNHCNLVLERQETTDSERNTTGEQYFFLDLSRYPEFRITDE